MTLYFLVKYLHVLGAIVILGTGTGTFHVIAGSSPVFGSGPLHTFAIEAENGMSLSAADASDYVCVPRATSELVYVRMHGPPQDSLYAGSYPDDELHQWADRISEWRGEGRRVLVYFNNDLGGHAIRNARTLKELLAASRLG